MKIALINTLYAPYRVGGAERSVQLLAEGLVADGHDVFVVTLQEPRRGTRLEIVNGVRLYRLSLRNVYWPWAGVERKPPYPARLVWHAIDRHNPGATRAVRKILEREQPDIVHTHNLTGFSAGVWNIANRLRVPIVHTIRDYSLMCPRGMYKNGANCAALCGACRFYSAPRRRASSALAAVIGVSRFVVARHENAGFFRGVPIKTVIHNAVGPSSERNRCLPSTGVPKGPLRLGYIGRLDPLKGIEHLIAAYHELVAEGAPVQLKVAGRGAPPYEAHLRDVAGKGPGVEWLGFIEPERFFGQIDVAVVPSVWEEPFGRTVIEALAFGVPVIAARRGGIPEIVVDGKNGWLYDPDEPGALRRLIGELVRAWPDVGHVAQEARSTAQAFTTERYVGQHEHLYGMVVES